MATVIAVGRVADDVPCRKCGYNLRGLGADGRCPECGAPVAVSLVGSLLRYSSPQWLRTLSRGAVLIICGFLVVVGTSFFVGVARSLRFISAVALLRALGLVGHIVAFIGCWLITEPDPSGVGEDLYGTYRRLIRVLLAVAIVDTAVTMSSPTTFLDSSQMLMVKSFRIVAGLAAVVGYFAQLQYFGKLAERIPDFSLVRRARFLRITLPSSYLVYTLGSAVLMIVIATQRTAAGRTLAAFQAAATQRAAVAQAGSPVPPPVLPTGAMGSLIGAGCFMAIIGLVFLVFAVMYVFLINGMRTRFNAQAVLATQAWAEAGMVPPAP